MANNFVTNRRQKEYKFVKKRNKSRLLAKYVIKGAVKMKLIKTIICAILIFSISSICVAGLSKFGSRSEEVRQIQTKLKRGGYYNGAIDGIFGSETKKAVIYFQKKRY